jgi:hypothetical protein
MTNEEFPSLEEAKSYALKKGYKYAHMWFNSFKACACFEPSLKKDLEKKGWKKLMDRHEKKCKEAICYGRHIYDLASPVRWAGEI